ncbi:MAG: hypothetical protein OXF79_21220 [Chloroflexi bacterium]|nr:hypothetical protein [Chloroflexota bacterium]
MKINKTVAILGIAVLALMIGAGAWFALFQNSETQVANASGIIHAMTDDVDAISGSLTSGQIFYYKTESYMTDRHGTSGLNQYPSNVVYETWLQVGSNGLIDNSVTTMSDPDGTLLQYAIGTGSTIVQTDVATRDVIELELAPTSTTLNEWLQASAARPQQLLSDDDYDFVGRGTMGKATSVIFEYEYESHTHADGTRNPSGKVKLEFVESDPLLNSETHYLTGSNSVEALVESNETVDYKILKSGSQMPTFP